jgi:Family of unknown function (DUF6328)
MRPTMSDPPGAQGRDETDLERYDRNLTELMGELRVALPGVQVLFGFLLVAPFNARFSRTTEFERKLYFATLLLTLLASILLIAPTIFHRLTFRQGRKFDVVQAGNRFTIVGLLVLAVAMTGAIALVTHYLFGQTTTIITAALAAVVFTGLWFVLPLHHRHQPR